MSGLWEVPCFQVLRTAAVHRTAVRQSTHPHLITPWSHLKLHQHLNRAPLNAIAVSIGGMIKWTSLIESLNEPLCKL